MCDNFLYVFKGTPSARRAVRPSRGSGQVTGSPRRALDRRWFPPWAAEVAGSRAVGAGSVARCLSVGDARRGRLPPHRPPAPAARRFPPSRTTGSRACQSDRAVLLAPGILSPRKLAVKGAAHGPRPSASLRADP
jgi:hypothetical protein